MFTSTLLVIAKTGNNSNDHYSVLINKLIYSYNEILLSNKKEWTIDTFNNTNESQNNYTE